MYMGNVLDLKFLKSIFCGLLLLLQQTVSFLLPGSKRWAYESDPLEKIAHPTTTTIQKKPENQSQAVRKSLNFSTK